MYAVCFGSHSVCEACNGSGEMGMGIGVNRGRQQDRAMDAMGGHVNGSKGKGPKIRTWIFISSLNNLPVVSHSAFVFVEVDVHPTFVNTCISNSKAIDKSGIMCPVRTKGGPSM
jgi:hypothetical protein